MLDLISAPTNLGLRPPEAGCVPGTAKAPEALREAGLHQRLARVSRDVGVVLPGRYRDDYRPGRARLRNQEAIVDYTTRLAGRIAGSLGIGHTPLVLGGDCSVLVAAGLALARRGRFGLVHLDGHTDFRHPGNSDDCASLAGEDLAAVVGRHWDAISNLEERRPYIEPEHALHLGCRPDDAYLDEVMATIALTMTSEEIRARGALDAGTAAVELLSCGPVDGYWIHLDVDILDAAVMPAVDSPSGNGLSVSELTTLLSVVCPGAIGADVTIFDPDLDFDGRHARTVATVIETGLARLGDGSSHP
jgi:arginase